MRGLLQEGTPMQWRWIEKGTVMPAGDLGTWPVTVEIEEEGGRWMEEGWSRGEDESRRFLITRTI